MVLEVFVREKFFLVCLFLSFSTTGFAAIKPKKLSYSEEKKSCPIKEHTRFEKIQNTAAFVASSGAYMLWTQDCLYSDRAYKKVIGTFGVINIVLTTKTMIKDWKWYVAYLASIAQPCRVKKTLSPVF